MDNKLRSEMEEFRKYNSDSYRKKISMNFFFNIENLEKNMAHAEGELVRFVKGEEKAYE